MTASVAATQKMLKEGFLERKGAGSAFGSKWKKMWCVLTQDAILMYAKKVTSSTRASATAKEMVELVPGTIVTKVDDKANEYRFSIVAGKSEDAEEWLFRAESATDRDNWILSIQVLFPDELEPPPGASTGRRISANLPTPTEPSSRPKSVYDFDADAASVEAAAAAAAAESAGTPSEPSASAPSTPRETPPATPTASERGDGDGAAATATATAASSTAAASSSAPGGSKTESAGAADTSTGSSASADMKKQTLKGKKKDKKKDKDKKKARGPFAAPPVVDAAGVNLPAGVEFRDSALLTADSPLLARGEPPTTPPVVVDSAYLPAQSAVPLRLTQVLHAEREFVSRLNALDADTSALVAHYSELASALSTTVDAIAAAVSIVDPQRCGREFYASGDTSRPATSDLLANISALTVQRAILRNNCIATLQAIVHKLQDKEGEYQSRIDELNGQLTALFGEFEAVENNPLKDADAVSRFTGVTKLLYNLHSAVHAALAEVLAAVGGSRNELTGAVTYPGLDCVREDLQRYTACLHEHHRLSGLDGEPSRIWAAIVENRKKILDVQDEKETLVSELRAMNRRATDHNASAEATRSKADVRKAIDASTEALDKLDRKQTSLRERLEYLGRNGQPEAGLVPPADSAVPAEAVPVHLVASRIRVARSIDQYVEIVADRFAETPAHLPGVAMRFEGHKCAVCKVAITSPAALARFESEVLLPLRHPHPLLLPVEAVFYEGSYGEPFAHPLEEVANAYVQYPYPDGPSLRSWLAGLSRTDGDHDAISAMFRCVLQGLSHLHSNGVYHGDLQPDRITLDGDTGLPQLTGFGLAGADSVVKALASNSMQYVAPEVEKAPAELTAGRDMYAFGAMLYEARFGAPFDKTSWAAKASELNKSSAGDAGLWAVLERVLSDDPASRADPASLLLAPYFVCPKVKSTAANEDANARTALDARYAALVDAYAYVDGLRSGSCPSTSAVDPIEVSRENVVADVLGHFSSDGAVWPQKRLVFPARPESTWTGDANSEFAIETTGVYESFFRELPLAKPELFETTPSGALLPTGSADDHKAVGRVILACIVLGLPVPLALATPVVSYLVGREPAGLDWHAAVQELEYCDGLRGLQCRNIMASKLDDESGLTLDGFVANGDTTVITDGNKAERVTSLVQHVLVDSRRTALDGLKAGVLSDAGVAEKLAALAPAEAAVFVFGPAHVSAAVVRSVLPPAGDGAAPEYAALLNTTDNLGEHGQKLFLRRCAGSILINEPVLPKPFQVLCGPVGPVFRICPDLVSLQLPAGAGAEAVANHILRALANQDELVAPEPAAATPAPAAPAAAGASGSGSGSTAKASTPAAAAAAKKKAPAPPPAAAAGAAGAANDDAPPPPAQLPPPPPANE